MMAQPRSGVLIDTAVWKEYFRKEEVTFQAVNALMDAGRICCPEIVIAELLLTSPDEREKKVFRDFTQVFPMLQEPPKVWLRAADMAFQLRQKKRSISLRDCYLAVMAQEHRVLLYTKNRALRRAGKLLGIEFYPERSKPR